ncbi:MAG: FKBP-type peptidyl-prolyl cis-trans isomerase [Candidatus Aureabacteria bacterium]|nr:FKBP-type peptidyl-prolyl cis-trans isomerase [Candidatus Auribacterota bacterium]
MKQMMTNVVVLLALTCGYFIWGADEAKPSESEFNTEIEKYSYMVGQDIGNSIKRLQIELDIIALSRGIEDVLKNNPSLFSPDELTKIRQEFTAKLQVQHAARMKEEGEKNSTETAAFLEESKKKPDVKTTASGLQYRIISEGTGPLPKATDKVKVHYKGTLVNGKEFDSSYKRGMPAEFQINGVIPGWSEALQLMKVGSKFQIFIPPNLAYGENGAGPDIGPNALLIFEVELLEIVK